MSTTARYTMTGALRGIQAPVRDELDQVSEEVRRIITAHLPLMEEVNDHLLQMQGKMFRPTLVLLANAVDERPDARAVPLAAIVEIIHLATLVHDDSVDHSSLRRGMPTVNSVFSHQISVIMGDYLYSRALAELVHRGEIDGIGILTDATTKMTIGEMRQLASLDALAFTEGEYETLIHSKTSTLMAAACELGALAGAPRFRQELALYGERLGMAFQVADDLLDYTEDPSVTGKPTGLDLREHKVTLPLIYVLPRLSPAARARVDTLFAADVPDDRDIAEVIGIVKEYGGLDYARRRGERFAEEAHESLSGLPDTPARAALTEAIGYVMDRRS